MFVYTSYILPLCPVFLTVILIVALTRQILVQQAACYTVQYIQYEHMIL